MAVTVITGYDGMVTWSGMSGKVNSFSFAVDVNAIDTTGFTDSGWRNITEGCKQATAVVNGFALAGSGSAAPITSFANGGFSITLTLQAATGCTISGSGLVTRFALDRPTCDSAKCTWNISFYGQPTLTWA